MCIANILSSIFWTLITVNDGNVIQSILLNYNLSTILVSIVIYFVLVYIFKTKELYLKLKYENTKDHLTGLNNVREFDTLLNKSISDTVENNKELSLLLIDLDFFKRINDTFGHSSGDMILKQFSDILVNSCRPSDIVSRNGGEEFTVILSNCNYKLAAEIAERIRKNVEDHYFITDKNGKIKITVSIGISSYPNITNDTSELIDDADKALYYAKQNGKNQVH